MYASGNKQNISFLSCAKTDLLQSEIKSKS